ncbi:type III pantothenate kinase [Desulforhopalus singaporensis]|uniref:Type III pantothenate kinase n=1 Tax=Desulforhopalus singaporensis TaxID=91360 RepID=A0A1H0QJZ5_9BACT|nr:type III pantothenate kinase [Desulforhopalus singaporensis]SDP16988.1 pantothenate kinase [Desulforhopalus singaporensis]
MFLVVDIGNSHTVTGIFKDGKLVGQWRIKSESKSTADELGINYHTLFSLSGIDKGDIEGVVIASVVPTLQTAWVNFCKKHFSTLKESDIFVVNVDKIKDLITVRLDNPKEVGADRLVNGIAAWNLYRSKQVVIDFGTAITFDCITEKCDYLGGAILPGIAISLEALADRTAQLPHIDVSEMPSSVIGKSTVEAMKSGLLYGYGAMIDGLVKNIKTEMIADQDEEFRVVATGGMAQLIAPFADSIDVIEPMLTIYGLEYIYNTLVK